MKKAAVVADTIEESDKVISEKKVVKIKKRKDKKNRSLTTYHLPLFVYSSYKVGILTCSTDWVSLTGEDKSGKMIQTLLKKWSPRLKTNFQIVKYKIVPDNFKLIASVLKKWSDREKLDLILTVGGTGFSPSDVTPEATKSVLDKEAPGLSEAMRLFSNQSSFDRLRMQSVTNHSLLVTHHLSLFSFLSRGVCGIRKKTLILNLPGSAGGSKECLEAILPLLSHAIELVRGLN